MFKKLLQKKTAPPPQENVQRIDVALLEEQLDCIKVLLLEIRCFRRKKIVRSPTHQFIQTIDIEEAWISVQNVFRQAFEALCHVADLFSVEHESIPEVTMFGTAIDQFVNLIDRITLFLDEHGIANLGAAELETIDRTILHVQQSVNRIQQHVMVGFDFTNKKA